MAEAAEIAKLRLFLKLAAQLNDKSQIEPLPDLDFNIKTGNLLVGIADERDLRRRFAERGVLPFGMDDAQEAARSAAEAYDDFVKAQAADTGTSADGKAKLELAACIKTITDSADEAIHEMRNESMSLKDWRESHNPFHWFAEFPSVWQDGGFDVVIGNPPYIGLKGKKKEDLGYTWTGYFTQKCPNLYAVCTERASMLLNDRGRFAMIVMHSLCFSKDFPLLRKHLREFSSELWVSAYDRRPSSGLFLGSAAVRNAIIVASKGDTDCRMFTSVCHRWRSEARLTLFQSLQYIEPQKELLKCGPSEGWPMIDSRELGRGLAKLLRTQSVLGDSIVRHSEIQLGYKKVALYVLGIFFLAPPVINSDGSQSISPNDGWLSFKSERQRDLASVVLASRWAYVWWLMYGDSFNVTKGVLAALPSGLEQLALSVLKTTDRPLQSTVMAINAPQQRVNLLLRLAAKLKEELPLHLKQGHHAKKDFGRYDLRECRHITDEADWLLAQIWGIEDAFEAAGKLRDRMTFGSRD